MNRLPNIHPGEILREEFLKPMGISQSRLAKAIGVPAMRISEMCAGKRSITADTALRFSRASPPRRDSGLAYRPTTTPKRLKKSPGNRLPASRRWPREWEELTQAMGLNPKQLA